MIIKTSVSFLNTISDSMLVTKTETILVAMTGNLSYPTPSPTLAAVTAAKAEFVTAMADAADGGTTLTAIKDEKRAALVALLRQLASDVQVACKGNLAVLLSSGFPIQKPQRVPIGVLPAPSNVTLALGSRTGELDAAASPLVGAGTYNWRLSTATAPNVDVQTDQTTAASSSFSGLTPGVVYNVEVNAVGASGISDWSDPVAQMAV